MDGNFNSKEITGSGRAVNYFLGMSAGVVSVLLSSRIPYGTKKMIDLFEKRLCRESVAF